MTEREKTRGRDGKPNELILALKEADDFTRAKIMEKLVSSPNKAMVQQVAGLLEQKNTSLRMDVLEILKKIGNCSIETIIQLLYHPNEDVRVYGCEVLAVLKHDASLPYLIEKVREDNENVRNAAIMALTAFWIADRPERLASPWPAERTAKMLRQKGDYDMLKSFNLWTFGDLGLDSSTGVN